MIAPLRARHRAMFAALAIALPVTFLLALRARDDESNVAALPKPLASEPLSVDKDLGMWGASFAPEFALQGMTVFLDEAQQEFVAEVYLHGEPFPDVLVYLAAQRPSQKELPPGSTLLGALKRSNYRYMLPHDPRGTGEAIVLFSLAHGEVVSWLVFSDKDH